LRSRPEPPGAGSRRRLSRALRERLQLPATGQGCGVGVLLPSSKIYVTDSLPAGDPQKPVVERFVREYEKKCGKPPATFAGSSHDAAMMIMDAIRRSAPTRRSCDAIGRRRITGVTAVYAYSPADHYGTKPESVDASVKDGKSWPESRSGDRGRN
jgi:hypothetical protein